MGNTVRVKLRRDTTDDDGNPVAALYEDVDLDTLTPRARALVEAVAATPLRTAVDIWVQRDRPIRDTAPDWALWYTDAQAAQPERRAWRGWSDYPATSTMSPAEYLEQQARRIPPDWHPLGAHPAAPVPSLEAGAADTGMTRDTVLTWLREHDRPIAPGTWTGYVARGQAPKPRRHIGRTPLWDLADIEQWAAGTWRSGKQVHHRDGDPRNNETSNLELRDTPTTEGD